MFQNLLVKVFISGNPENFLKSYAVLDDQSNQSLGRSELFDNLNVPNNLVTYELKTCFGTMAAIGRHVRNLVIKCFYGIVHLLLPELTECNAIPFNSSEIPTPEVAKLQSHMRSFAETFPEPDPEATVLMLIGRYAPQQFKVRISDWIT